MKRRECTRRGFLYLAGLTVAATVTGCSTRFTSQTKKKSNRKPNFVIFFTDDQGYNDVGCFGSPNIKTPNFDRMAGEGMRFADFYAQPVCGPSRAALMTGCYPIRIAEPENIKNQHNIMAPSEITIAELLKQQEYRTALIGKWHLAGQRSTGYKSELLPNGQGFDYFYGTPVHNGYSRVVDHKSFKTQLMRNSEMLKDALTQQDMDMLTQDYTREAVQFITENKDKPFFLYLAHNMPHVPLGASPKFRGRSKRGLYGDVIEELDWSMGQVLETLKKLDIDDNTLVIYMSDNGPWIESHLGDYGGSADPLRGWKMSAWEGGSRVPCIMRWPGKIPAGKTCNELTTTMDIYPTFAELAGQEVPNDRIIDGKNIWSLMTGKPKSQSPHKAYYYYNYLRLNAVRSGKWKLVLPRPAKPAGTGWSGRMIDEVKEVELYDLDKDISETTSVAGKYPDVVKRLLNLVSEARDDLGDYTHFGKGARYLGESPPERAWPPRKKKS